MVRPWVACVMLVLAAWLPAPGQVNTDQVIRIGQNALYFEDYMLSIQYFNQAIEAKPYLAQPYFLRAVAKINLDDYVGAEADASRAIELNPYLTDAYEVRGVARQNRGRNRLAIEDYDAALQLLPRNRQLLFNKALAQTEVRDYAGATESYGALLRHYPNFGNGYLGRARLLLLKGDTIAAGADIDRAVAIDNRDPNAFIMRADIAINSAHDFDSALVDINRAIRLLPQHAGLYINRAFIRYKLDSYNGAMEDYDYALTLDPLNKTALFNRGLLLAEVAANDRALDDFNRVLELDPNDYRAIFNRAIIHHLKGNYSEALADVERVAERYPDFPGAVQLRAAIYHDMGCLTEAERDYRRAGAMARALHPAPSTAEAAGAGGDAAQAAPEADDEEELSADLAGRRFKTLLTVDDNATLRREYNNSAIRGRVQDRNFNVETEPMMMLSFYSSPTELRPGGIYVREVDDINATRMLRFLLTVTNAVPTIDESTAARHFQSIEYYNSYLSTHPGRPVDFIGRALDFITVRDYLNAERDASRAIELAPDLALAYLIRSQARYGRYLLERDGSGATSDAATRTLLARAALDAVAQDLDAVLHLSPNMAAAWFNKGNVLFESGDPEGAIGAYTTAIGIKSDFGEAYFNRGYMYLSLGRQAEGIADLSKAGELGIVAAYNLIKRVSR